MRKAFALTFLSIFWPIHLLLAQDFDSEYFTPEIIQIERPVLNVAVCLPFELDEESPTKAGQYATEFYKGFLLGLDSLRMAYGNPPLNIIAIDTGKGIDLHNKLLDKADIIIAPESSSQLAELGAFGLKNKKYIFNTFQARDSTFQENPYMIQGNIVANAMYSKAIDWFLQNLYDAVPVILDNETGKKDRLPFVEALTQKLNEIGREFIMLTYDGALTSSALLSNLPEDATGLVFIPTSGAHNEFQKISTALVNYKNALAETGTTKIRLFGYPEYTRFTGDSYDKMKTIGTTIFSRFYFDPNTLYEHPVNNSYMERYGESLPDGVPNQAMYGFDVAQWILKLTRNESLNPEGILNTHLDDGQQVAYRFMSIPGGGFANDAILLVTLGEEIETIVEIK